MRIPKRIYTIWLTEKKEWPRLIKKCIESQKIDGYEHRLITLDNCFKNSEYMKQCLNSKYTNQKWCKASDYLRMHYLYNEGGIYLDADVEIIKGKNFDEMLSNQMFAGREDNCYIGTAVVGAEAKHPFLKRWIKEVEDNFRGDDNLCFESSMELLTRGYHEWGWNKDGFKIYNDTSVFIPYNHTNNRLNITDKSVTIHHFTVTWAKGLI